MSLTGSESLLRAFYRQSNPAVPRLSPSVVSMSMALDGSIIGLCLDSPQVFNRLRQGGVTDDHFVDDYQKVWRWVLRMKKEHGHAPSVEVTQARFHELDFHVPKSRDLPILLSDLHKRKKYTDFLLAIDEASMTANSPDELDVALAQLQGRMNELIIRSGKSNIVDLFSEDASKRIITDIKRRRSGLNSGIPTGLRRLDTVTGGLQKREMYVIMSRPGIGKAQPLDAKILTPGGWRTMGDMRVGSKVTCPDGTTARVVQVHPQGRKDIYRVSFSDGASTEVTADHLWKTQTRNERRRNAWSVKTTTEIASSLRDGSHWNHDIPLPEGLECFKRSKRGDMISLAAKQGRAVRTIRSVEKVRRAEAQCITIDHPDHLYVTDDYIVTHNSWLNVLFAANAVMAGRKVLLYPLEMTLETTALRLYTVMSQRMLGGKKVFRNTDLSRGVVSKAKIVKFFHLLEDKFEGQMLVADVGNMSDPYTVERIDAEVEAHKPDMFWVDYITLMKAPGVGRDGGEDHTTVKALSNGIKHIAMRHDCVGGASAQVNREAIKGRQFLPRVEHIAYGDAIGQDATGVVSINKKGPHLYYSLVKHRHGPEVGRTRCKFFVDEGLMEETADQDDDDED